jgi:hypothetical protein
MIHAQNATHKILVNNVARTAGNTAIGIIDCVGSDYATLHFIVTAPATPSFPSATGATITVLESAVDHVSNVSAASAIATISDVTALKEAAHVLRHIDMKGRKRYLLARVVAGAAGVSNEAITVSCLGSLTRKEQSPTSAAAMVGTYTTDSVAIG